MFDSEEPKEGEEEEEPADEGPREMTLDEYRAMQSTLNPKNTGFNIRKAGEGVDDKQWKKMYVLKKKPTDENSDEDEYEVSDRTTLTLVFFRQSE